MSILARSGRSVGALLCLCLPELLLASCARFGFERQPSEGAGPSRVFDAGLAPVSRFDGGLPGGQDAGREPPAHAPDASAGASDAGAVPPPGADAGDAGTTAPERCVAFGPFEPPALVTGLGQNTSFGPALSDDALTLLYVTNYPYDIFITTRADRDSPFRTGAPLSGINRGGTDATPFLADGGLSLLFASDRFTTSGYNDLMLATRASLDEPFGQPTTLANVNSPGIELLPHQSADGLRLYFSSERSGSDRDIWLATRASRGQSFGAPAAVSALSSTSQDFGPSLSGDELEVIIASDRPGGEGSMDLWRAERASISDPFDAPVNLSPLNGPGYDTDPRLSPDGRELFFSSSRSGDQVLWVARRPCIQTAH